MDRQERACGHFPMFGELSIDGCDAAAFGKASWLQPSSVPENPGDLRSTGEPLYERKIRDKSPAFFCGAFAVGQA